MVQYGEQKTAPAQAASEVMSDRRRAALPFAFLSAVLMASVALPMPAQNGEIAHVPAFCPFYRLTGLPCPGCGLTRAFVCIGHGHWAQSLHWHPIGWLVYAAFLLLWLHAGLTLVRGRPLVPHSSRQQTALGAASLAILLTTGLARMAWLLIHHQQYV
ncbi:MAG TPA: DUF2752 domain-containing protein [Capsulimonadaceae bacterium]|nr:DUF2752 domain-containing protein [Capsulimonadaceae bacterium]